MLRIFGKHKFYVKNAQAIEKLGTADTVIFDKTGTITSNLENQICYEGNELTEEQKSELKSVLRASNHVLSRKIYRELANNEVIPISNFKEVVGKGIEANVANNLVRIGSQSFVNHVEEPSGLDTSVHISFNNKYTGRYTIKNKYRQGVQDVFQTLSQEHRTAILSGDNEGEKAYLKQLLPENTTMYFHQTPEDKLNYINQLQDNHQVVMVGDGLNDSGALAQSDVGIALSEDINVFSPACDAILDAKKFRLIPDFIQLSKQSIRVIQQAFVLSFLYNIVGLYFAVTGQLSPIIAAILMPLSSISIVVFTTLATNLISKKIYKHGTT